MAKKGLNIYRRKDGRWEGRVRIRVSSDGKTRYRSVYGRSYKEAREKVLELIKELDQEQEEKDREKQKKQEEAGREWLCPDSGRNCGPVAGGEKRGLEGVYLRLLFSDCGTAYSEDRKPGGKDVYRCLL